MRQPAHALTAFVLIALIAALSPATASASETHRGVTPQEARQWKPDVKAATRFARSRSTRVSFAVSDMRNRLHRQGGDDEYIMASTFKVMLLVAYLRQSSVRNRDLSDAERRLLAPMIRESDNDAATRVRDMLGPRPIERLADAAGMNSFAYNSIWGYCRTTPRDQAVFMRVLPGLVPGRHRDFALRLMSSIIKRHQWGVADIAPKGWKLHFKGGWGLRGYKVEHQVAVLTNGTRKVGIAVYTQGNPSRKYGRATLEGVFGRLLRDLPR